MGAIQGKCGYYQALLKNFNANDLIITATHQLAVFLQQEYAVLKKAQGNQVWCKPSIFSFSTWLKRLWFEAKLYMPDMLLSEEQEQALWQTVIQQISSSLFDHAISNSAKLAAEAFRLMQGWHLPFPFPSQNLSENSQIFQQWLIAFQKICRAQGWRVIAELPAYLQQAFQQSVLKCPERVTLIGFNEISVAHQALLETLRNLGVQINYNVPEFSAARIVSIEVSTVDDEILMMAQWAKQTLEQSGQNALIGCIVPTLEQRRFEVLNTFHQVFWGQESLFDISAPTPLGEVPLISIALMLFDLTCTNLSLEKLGLILRTPFIGDFSEEQLARMKLDSMLRCLHVDEISMETVLELASSKDKPFYCPLWRKKVIHFREFLGEVKSNLDLPSVWADRFIHAIQILGWPGARKLTEETKQTIQAFHQVFKTLSSLDLVLGKINWERARAQLCFAASRRLFQPQSEMMAPIQILGSLEAVGIPFTHVWILGLTDEIWPSLPHPHPLLPKDLQCQFDLPHASSMRELRFCEEMTAQFCRMGEYVILSSARYNGDIEQKPSHLLSQFEAYPNISLTSLLALQNIDVQPLEAVPHHAPDYFEYLVDDDAPPIVVGEHVKGGSYLFKLQSMCPFRAFAEMRLHAKLPDKAQSYLNAKERGSLIHQVLENIWNTLQNHARLSISSAEDLHQIIQKAVDISLLSIKKDCVLLAQGFTRVERKRLINLVKKWIEQKEKPRDPFRIFALESQVSVELAGQQFTFKLDRIDEYEKMGKKVVIDYKTGRVSKEDWFGERLNEPQLPLYCVTHNTSISGLLFAQVKTGQLAFQGLAEEGIAIEGVQTLSPEVWLKQKAEWKQHLENLAQQFLQGYAKVDPKEGKETCRFCELKLFCRIN